VGGGGGGGGLLKFATEIDRVVLSFLSSVRSIGTSMRTGIANPYRDACESYRTSSSGEYATYLHARARSVASRSKALASRGVYVDRVREFENAIRSLRRAVRMSRRRDAIVGGVLRRAGRATSATSAGSSRPSSPSNCDGNDDGMEEKEEETEKREEKEENEEEGGGEEGGKEEGDEEVERKEERGENEEKEKKGLAPSLLSSGTEAPLSTNDVIASTPSSTPSDLPQPWEDGLRKLADRYKLSRQVCESVTHLHDDVASAREDYAMGVLAENEAVEEVQALERMALDCLQRLEEVRGPKL
jgi:hypothetical protein